MMIGATMLTSQRCLPWQNLQLQIFLAIVLLMRRQIIGETIKVKGFSAIRSARVQNSRIQNCIPLSTRQVQIKISCLITPANRHHPPVLRRKRKFHLTSSHHASCSKTFQNFVKTAFNGILSNRKNKNSQKNSRKRHIK